MADRNKRRPTLNTYIDGNTVRKLDTVSRNYEYETSPRKRQEVTPARKPAKRPAQKPKVYREPKERTSLMTPVFAVYTTVVLAVVLFFAFRMLAAQTALAAAADNVAALESTLKNVNEENTKLEALIDAGVDLEYIYKTAVEELGLVAADNSQIIYYEQLESGYVRQNEIIP